jgi:tetratricopeptide (TPR) repeat protein
MTKCESSMARVIAALVPLLFVSAAARAQSNPDDAVAKITQLNKDAVTAYQAQKYDDARKILKQALDLSDSAGLEQHPITARTHIHMGIVILVGFKQRDLGIKQFKKALEIQSTINLTKALVTPELTDAFAEAKGAGAAPAAAAAPPATEPPAETP